MNFYNEIDPYAAQWLENLIAAGRIGKGTVERKRIETLDPASFASSTRCHFFAGIGGWDYALELAGWPPDVPVWTGSCPCQPYSAAGRQEGHSDERNLWPPWFGHIRIGRPQFIFGEQVANAIGFGWLDGISADLEAEGYTVGSIVLGAHSLGAPHIRQRLYYGARRLANTESGGLRINGRASREAGHSDQCSAVDRLAQPGCERGAGGAIFGPGKSSSENGSGTPDTTGRPGTTGRLGQPFESRLEGQPGHGDGRNEPGRVDTVPAGPAAKAGGNCGMEFSKVEQMGISRQPRQPRGPSRLGHTDIDGRRFIEERDGETDRRGETPSRPDPDRPGFWSEYDLVPCGDGKARRIEPGTFPLAYGIPARVGKLRAYGNAIVPQVAAEFIKAFMEWRQIGRYNDSLDR